MGKTKSISPKMIVVLSALVVLTAMIISCDGELQTPRFSLNAHASPSMDGGTDQTLGKAHFIIYGDTTGIDDVNVKAFIGTTNYPIDEVRFYTRDGFMVVTVDKVPQGPTYNFHFKALDSDGDTIVADGVMLECKTQAKIDQRLITFHNHEFGSNDQVANHNQPAEMSVDSYDSFNAALGHSSFMWIEEEKCFYDLRRVISLPSGAEPTSAECEVINLTPSLIGIASDGVEGDVVRIDL